MNSNWRTMKMKWIAFGLMAALAVVGSAQTWKQELRKQLPLLGHRNWVVVVDSAYPLQSSAGITTLWTGEDQVSVVRQVLVELKKQKHVRPIIYLDKELPMVPENAARGITQYRKQLANLLKGTEPLAMLHEEIIARLDEAGKTFHILVLKTNLTLPYTSVFFQLDCGYWSADKEKALRKKMGG